MKKIFLLLLVSSLVFSCTSRQKEVLNETQITKKDIESLVNKKIDSVYSVLNKKTDLSKEQIKNDITNKVVELTTELEAKFDEKGNPIPTSIEEIVDGVVKSKITNIGGKTVYKTYQSDTKQDSQIVSLKEITQVLENKFSYSKQENEKLKSEISELKKSLKKDIKTVDFTFGFYVLIVVVIILSLIILFFYIKIRGQTKILNQITSILPV